MLTSGNGQHRRPRQAPKFVVTVGARAGIALPLLSSGAAHAASATTWDEVASCETGGAWNANAGDGFYGGLALTLNVWERYGGTVYAKSPDLASRQQQIAVAQKVLDGQGAGYWTGCAIAVGLAQGGPTPEVNPGTPAPGGGAASDPAARRSAPRPAAHPGAHGLPGAFLVAFRADFGWFSAFVRFVGRAREFRAGRLRFGRARAVVKPDRLRRSPRQAAGYRW